MTWTCQCPREIDDSVPVCGSCSMQRPRNASPTPSSKCDDCHEPTRQVQLTPGDGKERCASCHVEYLRQRMRRDPISDEDLARCKAKLAKLAVAYARADAKWTSVRI